MGIGRHGRALRSGDLVEVRSATEILATLDPDGSLEAVPFMPEMLQHVGRRFTVSRRVEKICDTAGATSSSRRMRRTVFLEDLRCDGAGHGGCQAGCRLYWKEEWLRRVGVDSEQPEPDAAGRAELESLARAGTRTRRELDGKEVATYRCQATEAPAASEPLRGFDARQYLREVACGNVGPIHAVWVLGRAVGRGVLRRLGLRSNQQLRPRETAAAPEPERLDLQPGELVQVRSKAEIAATLDASGKNRGLWFDVEMVPHCGRTYRVQGRVERFRRHCV
ncbi:MAG: hypothetical protein HW413_1941 [Thermoleophilia bacterium]|nr:hypothetical protein [Thermoleophilia bacterium]